MNQGTVQSINNFVSDYSEILSYKGFGFSIEEEEEYNNNINVTKKRSLRKSDISNRSNKSDLQKSCPQSTGLRKKSLIVQNSQYTNNKYINLRNKLTSCQNYQPEKSSMQQNPNETKQNQNNQYFENLNPQFSENKFSPTGNNIFQENKDSAHNNSIHFNSNLNDDQKQPEGNLFFSPNQEDQKVDYEKQNLYFDMLKKQINDNHQIFNIPKIQNEYSKQLIPDKFKNNIKNIDSNNLIHINSKQNVSSTFALKVKTRKNVSLNEIQHKIALKKTDVSDIIDKMLQSSPRKQNLENKTNQENTSTIKDEENNIQNNNNNNDNHKKRNSFISQLKKDDKHDLLYVQQTDQMTKIQVKYKNKDLVLQFLTVDAVTDNSKNNPLVLVMVQDMWQDLYQKKVSEIQKDKMRVFASLSHELRTPLNCSISMLEVLKDEISRTNPNYIEEYLNPALFSNKLLLNQINDILDFVQMDSGKFKYSYQDFSIFNLLKDCQKLISMQAQMKNIQIKISLKINVPEIICSDPNRIRQILLNFLSNSLKFTQKGYIELGVNSTEISGLYEIYVKDTGIGITKENLQTIFSFCNKLVSLIFFANTEQKRKKYNPSNFISKQKYIYIILIYSQGLTQLKFYFIIFIIVKILFYYKKINYEKKDEGLNSQGCGLGLTISNSIAKGLVNNQSIEGGVNVSSEYGTGSIFSITVQDMNENRQSDQIDNVNEDFQSELFSPIKIGSIKKSTQIRELSPKRPQGKKKIIHNLINPSQVILEDDYSIDQNTSVDYLKQFNFKNNPTEAQNIDDSFIKDRNMLKPQFVKGACNLDSTIVIEVDDENNKYVEVHSNFSIKNDKKRFQEESTNSNNYSLPRFNENKSQNSISQNPQSTYGKIPQKSHKLQYYKTLEQLSQSDVQNNLTSENIASNRQMNSDAIGIYDNSIFENKERSYKDQEGFTSYVGFGRYIFEDTPQSMSRAYLHSYQNVDKYKSLRTSIGRDSNAEYSEEEDKRQQTGMDIQQNPEDIINQIIKLNTKQKLLCDCPQIMIVDDNQFNLYALAKTIQQFQFSCIQVSDGNQAMEEIKAIYSENCCLAPKIIFMDIEMPIKNGYQVAQEINQFQEEIQLQKKSVIIACTAYIGQEDHDKALEAGMDDFINKPILKNAFEQLILNWQNLFI